MIRDLQAANHVLPLYTSYNAARIPFAYPPLGLFLASFLSSLPGISLIDVLRLLPPILSTLAIPSFFVLGRSILREKTQAVIATFAFALLPTSFDWMVMGAGLTRALGFLFALFMLHQIRELLREPRKRLLLTATGLAALTILSHPGMAWFAAYSAVILFVAYGRNRKSLYRFAVVGAGSLLLTMPWWFTVLRRYGTSPFFAISGHTLSWSSLASSILLAFTNEPILDILAVVGLLGLLVCVRDRRLLLPAWLLVISFAQDRAWQICAVVPFAMLVGVGLDQVVLPALAETRRDPGGAGGDVTGDIRRGWQDLLMGLAPKLALGYVLVVGIVSATLAAPKDVLSRQQAEAMRWAGANTTAGSSFAVITGSADWSGDLVSEWFPAIAQRVSLATVQGYEWLPGGAFERRRVLHASLQACLTEDIGCLVEWARDAGVAPDYVYLAATGPRHGTSTLEDALISSPDFALVYENPEAKVFALR